MMHRSLLFLALAGTLAAQQFKLDLDRLAAKSSEHVDVSLDGDTLRFAARFLDAKDKDEAKVAKLVASLEGVYIRSFEFKTAGAWAAADLDGVRGQLRGPGWSRIVSVKGDGEESEIYLHKEGQRVTGIAVIATEPKEVTVVNIVGPVDLDALAELGGHFGIPKVDVPSKQ